MAADTVDVWQIDLAEPRAGIQQVRRLLSPDEIQRADRFYFEEHRRRFTVARAAMRQILARHTDCAPRDIVFSYGAKGKPELAGRLEKFGIKFNLSHSFDLGLLAVTRGLSVGADIELVSPEFATQEIARRFFSPREVDALSAQPPGERAEAFFSCWTRKEAYIKALGEGISVPLDSFEVTFGQGVVAALRRVTFDPGEISRWRVYDIQTTERYKAALVVEGQGHFLRHLQWDYGC